ncbi:hypothetical protein CEQ90_16255 [Lewinellaceae bacterium SD302]|nr:hypothetical protein CEQ90_16255 [Lewinellaceae bacterium SD302]
MRLILLFLLFALFGCGVSVPLATNYDPALQPPAPDYGQDIYWAALPTKDDQADMTPDGLDDRQSATIADVFYVHPTIYMDTRKGNDKWNANLGDEKLNENVDDSAIKNQASIFNAAGRVYAPRYRQAHLNVFRQRGSEVAEGALDLAYGDVLAAFDYYLQNYNDGRPIIIASHSQGTVHCARLLKDRFLDNDSLRGQLVAAYLIGMPVPADIFSRIPVCEEADQTGCFVSWRTFRNDYVPKREEQVEVAVVNPLNWSTEKEVYVPASANKGGVLYNFNKILPELVDAEIRGNLLYVKKPKFFGDIFFTRKNYHIGDLNLFWVNVRENAVERVEAWRVGAQ